MIASTAIYVVIVAVIGGLLWWLISYLPIPEPFKKIATAAVLIGTILLIIVKLLTLLR